MGCHNYRCTHVLTTKCIGKNTAYRPHKNEFDIIIFVVSAFVLNFHTITETGITNLFIEMNIFI